MCPGMRAGLVVSPADLTGGLHQLSRMRPDGDSEGEVVAAVKQLLLPHGIRLVGRFAEWEYFNMDAAIASAMGQLC